jgi:hypothetical protein
MNNNEHLALFILGVATLGITFLLLFALSDRNTSSIPLIDKQTQVRDVQAAVTPQSQLSEPPNMDALHREVAETFEKTAEYLGRGKYNENEHIALLERLEFYSGISSIRPEQKKAAQDFINDMNRLLTLKESVARKVRLSEQISTVVTDTQVHLAKGEKNEAEASKLMDRIEGLYAISGLSEIQNNQLRKSLAALKKAYTTTETRITSTPSRSSSRTDTRKAYTPKKISKKSVPVLKTKVEPKVEPKPVRKVPTPTQKVPAAKAAPVKATQTDPEVITKKFQSVMKYVARYFVEKKYIKWQHDNLTADLNEISKDKDSLSAIDQKRLSQTIKKMQRIKEQFGSSASTN